MGWKAQARWKEQARNGRLAVAKQMPPLRHKVDDRPFDIRRSEVAQWLCSQPSIMQYVFDKVGSGAGGLGVIEYDAETGTWQGVDWEGETVNEGVEGRNV